MLREFVGFLSSTQLRGLRTTLHLLAGEIAFDLRFGTETRKVLEQDQLGQLADGLGSRDLIYHAVNPVVLDRAFTMLRENSQADVWRGSFIDFGSGKGRGLILAANRGFARVLGIECSALLNDICTRNVQSATERQRIDAKIEILCVDAAALNVPDDSTVWFWFNPFDDKTTRQVAHNLIASLRRRPRNAYLIYVNPIHALALQALGFSTIAEVRLAAKHVDALIMQHEMGRS